MNAPIPCRVSADLRAYENSQPAEFTDDELDEAREELVQEIIGGKTRGGFDLNACLDCELNGDGYTVTVHDLAQLVTNSYEEGTAGTWLGLLALSERIVAKHLPREAVIGRAARIRAQKAEDAHG